MNIFSKMDSLNSDVDFSMQDITLPEDEITFGIKHALVGSMPVKCISPLTITDTDIFTKIEFKTHCHEGSTKVNRKSIRINKFDIRYGIYHEGTATFLAIFPNGLFCSRMNKLFDRFVLCSSSEDVLAKWQVIFFLDGVPTGELRGTIYDFFVFRDCKTDEVVFSEVSDGYASVIMSQISNVKRHFSTNFLSIDNFSLKVTSILFGGFKGKADSPVDFDGKNLNIKARFTFSTTKLKETGSDKRKRCLTCMRERYTVNLSSGDIDEFYICFEKPAMHIKPSKEFHEAVNANVSVCNVDVLVGCKTSITLIIDSDMETFMNTIGDSKALTTAVNYKVISYSKLQSILLDNLAMVKTEVGKETNIV